MSVDGVSSEGDSGAFVAPSKLQEASLWSTAVEQASLERRMREASMLHQPLPLSRSRGRLDWIGLDWIGIFFLLKTPSLLFKAVGLLEAHDTHDTHDTRSRRKRAQSVLYS